MFGKRFLNVRIGPVFGMAERAPTAKEATSIHLDVSDQGVAAIAQCLKRPAERIVLVVVIFPDKIIIRTLDGFSLRGRQTANENGDIASRCYNNTQCAKPSEFEIIGSEIGMGFACR